MSAIRRESDVAAIGEQLRFLEAVAAGTLEVAPFASMSQSERFHWLTTPRSNSFSPARCMRHER